MVFFFSLSLSSTLSFVLSSFLIGLGLWLFVGNGGIRVGFVRDGRQ